MVQRLGQRCQFRHWVMLFLPVVGRGLYIISLNLLALNETGLLTLTQRLFSSCLPTAGKDSLTVKGNYFAREWR
jgi:hypothetical protein